MSRKSAAPQRDDRTGTWWFVVDLGVDADGKRRQAKRRGFTTRKAAQEALDGLRVSVTNKAYVAPKRQRLAEYLTADWLPAVRASLEPSTWASYDRYLRLHVIPRIGGVQLQAVDPGTLNRLYADLLAEGGRLDGKPGGLSARTVRYVATIIGSALDDAVRWGRLVRNPARAAEPPKASQAKSPEMRTWDGPTVARFLEAEQGGRYHPAFLFLATTGCRRGEALGLRWADVDLDTGRASLRHTITAIDHQIHNNAAARTKTGRARVIDLDAGTVAALRSWRARQAQERLLMGAGYCDADLVFCHPDGRPYHPDRFSREFDRRVERHQLPRIRLHDLRHTWATLALQSGIDVKVVAERLGHSSTAITSNIYQHVTPAMATDAAERVAGLIFRS